MAEVILLVDAHLCFHNTKLNTSNHSEELKGQRKIKRSQHKTYWSIPHAFHFILFPFCLLDSSEAIQCVVKPQEASSVQLKSHQYQFYLPLLCTSVRLRSNFLDTCWNAKLYKKSLWNTSNVFFKVSSIKKHLFQPRSPAASYKTL